MNAEVEETLKLLDREHEIWRTYRRGQENTMTPSAEYLKAADAVQVWIREFIRGGSRNAAPSTAGQKR